MKKKNLKIVKKTIGVLADRQMNKVKAGFPTCDTRIQGNPDTGTRTGSTEPFSCIDTI